jgi:hypothetical protein
MEDGFLWKEARFSGPENVYKVCLRSGYRFVEIFVIFIRAHPSIGETTLDMKRAPRSCAALWTQIFLDTSLSFPYGK